MQHYGVIGYPIAQSLSPQMHEANFKSLNLNAHYEAYEVKDLSQHIQRLKKLNGFNVTVPHKESILLYLDGIDDLAQKIGAVNTVVCKNGQWFGYNTDAYGFYRSFSDFKVATDQSILIVGAGGAAKAVYYALKSKGYEQLTIANRTLQKAMAFGCNVLTLQQASDQLSQFSVIINTTSVGLVQGECPLTLENLQSSTIVMDLIYKPAMTTLLSVAKAKGCVVKNGLEMLVYQGALAFETWYDLPADVTTMKEVLEEALHVNR